MTVVFICAGPAPAAEPNRPKPVTPAAPADALLKVEPWQQTPLEPTRPEDLDALILAELDRSKPAPPTTDEQFVRRLYLDVAGRLPAAGEVERFVADPDPTKRARLIDGLLAGDEFARHWGRYWTEVVSSRVSPYMKRMAPVFEEWMAGQLRDNRPWNETVKAMLAAEAVLVDNVEPRPDGLPRFVPQPRNGAAFFVATRYYEKTRDQAAVDLAAETSRIFMGVQLQCAQCHDHPYDPWKREQFHQLAAFFARSGGRPRYDDNPGALGAWGLAYYPDGEYEMPGRDEPTHTSLTHPAFLDGRAPGEALGDRERRAALADYVTGKDNYWFAAAFINRTWGELMGQSFYQPVDDMGPSRPAVMPAVLTRLTGAFRGTDYDVKALFRTILNTQTYQRQFRLGDSARQHQHFAARCPDRMRPAVFWRVLRDALAPEPGADREDPGFEQRVEAEFLEEFQCDPSTSPEGSFGQALWLMNSYFVNSRIPATGSNALVRILRDYPEDDDAVRVLYLRTLGRRPTDSELNKCRQYVRKVGGRAEAFEDLLWVLVNSAEFQTKK